jgi:hypothetical protein
MKEGAMPENDRQSAFHQKQQVRSSGVLTPEELRRLELLKLQKELQRRELEQAKWRAASMPTRPAPVKKETNPAPPEPAIETRKEKNGPGFFARLLYRKLLE